MKKIIWNSIKRYVCAVFDCPKGVDCAACQRLNFFFDDVGFCARNREAMCRECTGKLTGDSLHVRRNLRPGLI
jgi:hypothetical protein